MRVLFLLLLAGACCPVLAQTTAPVGAPEVLFQTGFETRRELRRTWDARPAHRHAAVVGDDRQGTVLRFRSASERTLLLQKALPVRVVAGHKLHVRLRVRNAGISTPPAFYNGIKAIFHIQTPLGTLYPQCQVAATPFDWTELGFTTVVPPNATSCSFLLGLEAVSGTVYFNDLAIRVFPQEAGSPQAPPPAVPALRGAVISPHATAADLRTLAAWGANLVRWQLTWDGFPATPADTASLAGYRTWLSQAVAHVRALLPLCDSLGLRVLLDLHTLPGGAHFENAQLVEHRLFTSPAAQQEFRAIWKELATTLRAEPALWGYDLANEPVEGRLPDSVLNWQALAAAVASDIRRIDSVHTLVIEGAPSGTALALQALQPVGTTPPVVYSFHMYAPEPFTHQGVFDTAVVNYPGVVNGQYWDSSSLRIWLQPVRDWQLRHGVPVYVGEFSAIRWAPDSSAYRYLRDCIALFEEWGWSWTYHAFREWDGWSVEHGSDPDNHERALAPTDRQLLLQEAFSKNRR